MNEIMRLGEGKRVSGKEKVPRKNRATGSGACSTTYLGEGVFDTLFSACWTTSAGFGSVPVALGELKAGIDAADRAFGV